MEKDITIFCVLYLLLPPFYGHYAGQPEPALAGTPVKNEGFCWSSFTARMTLLIATSAFGLGRRC